MNTNTRPSVLPVFLLVTSAATSVATGCALGAETPEPEGSTSSELGRSGVVTRPPAAPEAAPQTESACAPCEVGLNGRNLLEPQACWVAVCGADRLNYYCENGTWHGTGVACGGKL